MSFFIKLTYMNVLMKVSHRDRSDDDGGGGGYY